MNEVVSFRRWDAYKRRCENAELRRAGRCRSVGDFCSPFVVEVRSDLRDMVVRPGWKEAMKVAANPERWPVGWELESACWRRVPEKVGG